MDKKIRIENDNLVNILRLKLEEKVKEDYTEENSISEDSILAQKDFWDRNIDDVEYYDDWYKDFTQEELDSITELEICYEEVRDIKDLEKLHNLKKLSIISGNSNLYAKFENGEIDVESEENLSKLDVTNMKNLKKLELINNMNLKEVIGLNETENLEKILMSKNGTGSLELREFDIMSTVENRKLKEVILDVDMYPNLIKKFPHLAEKIEEYEKNNERVYTWIENRIVYNCWANKFSTRDVKEMDIKVEEILQNIIEPEYTEIEKTLAIYNYITDNVDYDHKMLEFDERMQKDVRYSLFLEGRSNKSSYSIINKRILGKQSSFNGIMKGKAVCQGYANMMHYMLTKENIESRETMCINVIATQSYSSLYNALNDEFSTDVIIQSLVNKIWYRQDDIRTIEKAQKLIGKEEKQKVSKTMSESSKETNYNYILKKFISQNSNLSESINKYTVLEEKYDLKEFSYNLKTFEAIVLLSNGCNSYTKITEDGNNSVIKIKMIPHFLKE